MTEISNRQSILYLLQALEKYHIGASQFHDRVQTALNVLMDGYNVLYTPNTDMFEEAIAQSIVHYVNKEAFTYDEALDDIRYWIYECLLSPSKLMEDGGKVILSDEGPTFVIKDAESILKLFDYYKEHK